MHSVEFRGPYAILTSVGIRTILIGIARKLQNDNVK